MVFMPFKFSPPTFTSSLKAEMNCLPSLLMAFHQLKRGHLIQLHFINEGEQFFNDISAAHFVVTIVSVAIVFFNKL